MSVLECSRKGCEHIMCDRYSSTYGYICNECFTELKESHLHPLVFMETDKKLDKYAQEFKDLYNELMEKEFPIK